MINEAVIRLIKPNIHNHEHAENRFAVIPTPVRLNADPAYTGRNVTIAFLDSGFYPHPDLTEPVNRIIAFKDLSGHETTLDPRPTPRGIQWHGMQTTVAAAGNGKLSNGVYRGLASDAQLVLVKASDEQGRITEETIARGLEWILENRERYNIRVLNISLGGDEDVACTESVIDQLAEKAVRAGIVVVVAAGNSGGGERHHSIPPANSPSVITVGGYDDENQLADRNFNLYHSNYGPTADGTLKPEIIAPAMWIAAPILPQTENYRIAERLSLMAAAPDYKLRSFAYEYWREAALPETILTAPLRIIRYAVEAHLREHKIIATHYQHVDGTSFAAPIVSSVVAQMLEANPQLTPAAVRHILISTADRLSNAPAVRQGYGVLNARRAVAEARREQHALDQANYGPPRITEGQIVFSYHDDAAQQVELAGDFNNWNPSRIFFVQGENGVWRAEIACPGPGCYRYKFIIGGERWVDDPSNGLKEPDEYGGFNSILHIA